jgi:SAM-dependent MidA family methyltransferase
MIPRMNPAIQPPDEAMPFDEWMRRALFDPQSGYYAHHIRAVGRRGDFSTSATTGHALGEAVAHWLKEEFRLAPSVRTVIEVGGGDGSLMRAVQRSLGFIGRWGVRFFMVENSPVLREQQQAASGPAMASLEGMTSVLRACEGRALIFHNELLDAFPVTLAERDENAWHEVWLAWRDGKWHEELRPLRLTKVVRHAYSALSSQQAGQRVELGVAARDWLREWAPHWRGGAMLTLDYGGEFPQLYQRRPRGTLRAYLAHQCLGGAEVYANMGRQDITADVNFTDIRRWGEALGWRTVWDGTQREFLQSRVRDFARRLGQDAALRFLADEHGAGGAFRALVQRAD